MKQIKIFLIAFLTFSFTHCIESSTYPTIGGTVKGLDGAIVLQNNGEDDLKIKKNGSFVFTDAVLFSGRYQVTIKTQPTGQVCIVSNEEGVADQKVSNIIVTCADKAASGEPDALPTTITASISNLALSVNDTGLNAALTGTERFVEISNTGIVPTQALHIFALESLPAGTTITNDTCEGTELSGGALCSFGITPGSTPSAVPGDTAPDPIPFAIEADNTNTLGLNVHILTYGSVYQGGFVYAINDTTSSVASVGGKVVSLNDQADPQIIAPPTPNNVIWGSNGDGRADSDVANDAILGISEISTVMTPTPTMPAYPMGTPAYTGCNGHIDGACNTANIVSYYNFNRASGGAAPTPLTYYAAGLCKQTISGYSDWYLPAFCEAVPDMACPTMQNIGTSLPILLGYLTAGTPSTSCTAGANCIAGRYWSSTESNTSPTDTAWSVMLQDTPLYAQEQTKDIQMGVRCSRAITF